MIHTYWHNEPIRFDDDAYLRVTHIYVRRYTIHNNNISQQLINFVSTTPLALEIIIPVEFAGGLSSFVYFCIILGRFLLYRIWLNIILVQIL